MSTPKHEFEALSGRCVHCGTRKVFHDSVPGGTPCPQSTSHAEPLRPEPARREYAIDDVATISARMVELRAERDIVLNTPAKDDAI